MNKQRQNSRENVSECEENFDFLGIFGVLNFSGMSSRGGAFTYGVPTTWDTPRFWVIFLSHLPSALRYRVEVVCVIAELAPDKSGGNISFSQSVNSSRDVLT